MILTPTLIGSLVALALAAVYAGSHLWVPRVADPAAAAPEPPEPRPSSRWQITVLESLSVAEKMLDFMESHGHPDHRLVVLGEDRFAIRWR